ncbi:MAG: class I poly(R)-hydroxyalkanoic acid synthase [Pseudomonadota bacterium]
MTDHRNFFDGANTTLPNLFSGLKPQDLQGLSASLLQASLEAQGLITDMMEAAQTAPLSPQRPDPFGSFDAQMKVAAALARNPEKAGHAMMTFFQGWMNLFQSMASGSELSPDRRFADPEWQANPAFDFMRRAWTLNADWLMGLVDSVSVDLDDATVTKARFFLQQMIDAMAPTNLPATNPAALRAMVETGGQSVIEGLRNARRDLARGKSGRLALTQTDEDAFRVGENVATAPGKVIFRNKLIEVIHYNPTRKKMRARPMLIFPPWINKFYILDLQPANSMIRWLLSKRVNTFVVSWRSADDETQDYTWDDYVEQGILAALDAVTEETGQDSVNTVGYCIGGTLLTTALGHMAQVGDERIHSATYFASQADFEQAGELKIFTAPEALGQIEDIIEDHGGLMPGEMMGETFNWLRPADLVWRYVVDNYMLGKPPKPFDLLYWNADQTNIPGPTHRTYLKQLYHENALSEGRFSVFGRPVSMADIDVPVYTQASRSDHICPWHSIYRGAQKFGGDVTFTLAGSGHIAGVINHPDAGKYQHWINPALPDNPGKWMRHAEERPGSWWPHWWDWLKPLSGPKIDAVQPRDRALGSAPGQYAAMRLRDIADGEKPAGPYSDGSYPTPAPAPSPAKKPSFRVPAGWMPKG